MKNWPSLRPALGLLAFLEFLFWALAASAWFTAQALVPSLTLHRLEFWPLLMLSGLLTLVMVAHLRWRHKAVQSLADASRLDSVFEGYRLFLPTWKFVLVRLALGAMLVAWLDPKMGSKLQEVESEGVDMMVALDVSNSMLAEDVGMPRLDLAKRTVERLLSATAGDRIGLVVFAGEAYVQCPLTTDIEAVKMFLESVHPGMIPTQGTAVGRAVDACWNGFDSNSEASRVVVVLTDGENHEDDVVLAARNVVDEGGSVHFLGFATLDGGPIPSFDVRGRPSGFRTDKDGQPVVSRLDEATLIEAAQAGGGTYTRAAKGYVELAPLLEFKSSLDRAQVSSVSYVDYEHLLLPWLVLAAFLLLLESLLPKKPFRRHALVALLLPLAMGLHQTASAQTSAREHLVRGTEAFYDGQTDEAIVEFGGATTDSESAPLAHYNQGCAYLAEQDFASASEAFGRALQQTEEPALQERAHYNASLSALMQGDAGKAIEHAKSTLRINPSNDDARRNLALAKRLEQQQQQQQQQQDQDSEQDQDQDQDQDSEQDQDQDQDQNQDSEQNQDQDQGQGQDQDQDQDSERGQDQEQEQEQEQQQGQQNQPQEGQEQPQEGQISRADMERILESLERQEAEVQAKLRAVQAKAQGQGKSKSIEKDW